MKGLKKYLGVIAGIVMAIAMLPSMPVYASGKVVVAVSSSSLNIGDTVTVTATAQGPGGAQTTATLGFNYDSSKLSFVSCSDSTYAGGGGGYVGVVGEKASITLKATAAGSASVSVSGSDGVIFSSGEEIGSLSAGGATIAVNNAAGNANNNQSGDSNAGSSAGSTAENGNAGNTDNTDNANKSGDNSLSSLSISPGAISPAFKYSTTSYTASVEADVNEIAVDAKPSNSKATVESVSGNTNLKEGQNTITIVVKAENGTTATYKIVVTKGAGTSEQEEEPKEEETGEENADAITLNGHEFDLAAAIPVDKVPEDFTKTTVKCKGQEVEALKFNNGDIVLVYLTTPDTEVKNTFAVYDEKSDAIYPFVKIAMGNGYYILLNPPAETELSDAYTASNIEIGEYSGITAYANQEPDFSDFYLVYAVSKSGNTGWYQYDKTEGTLQRYIQLAEAETVDEEAVNAELKGLQNSYDKLNKQYTKEKSSARKTSAVLIFVIAVLIVVIVNLILQRRKNNDDEWEDGFSEVPKRFRKSEEAGEERAELKRKTPERKVPQKKIPEEGVSEPKRPEKKAPEQKQPEKEKPENDLEDNDDFEVINLDDL